MPKLKYLWNTGLEKLLSIVGLRNLFCFDSFTNNHINLVKKTTNSQKDRSDQQNWYDNHWMNQSKQNFLLQEHITIFHF